MHDFKHLDSIMKFAYKEDLYKLIHNKGYSYVSEFVYDEYYKNLSSVETISKKLNRSHTGARIWMRKWNFTFRDIKTRNKIGQQTKKKKELFYENTRISRTT